MSESKQFEPAEFQEALAYQESEEEVQLWTSAYSVRMFLPVLVIGLPITGVLFALARFWDPDGESKVLRYGVEGVLALTWLVFLIFACQRVLGTEYMLTNKRLYCRRGFGHPGLAGVDLVNFLDVRVKQNGLERLLRAGRIVLSTGGASGSASVLAGVADPERVVALFRKQLREAHPARG
ncbi:hypothetical protein BH10PLA2_BH10PLA2_31840 [soil metagenome]